MDFGLEVPRPGASAGPVNLSVAGLTNRAVPAMTVWMT